VLGFFSLNLFVIEVHRNFVFNFLDTDHLAQAPLNIDDHIVVIVDFCPLLLNTLKVVIAVLMTKLLHPSFKLDDLFLTIFDTALK
jgi:hypothetical protein